MAQFEYVGRHRSGSIKSGKLMSDSRREAILKLKDKGIAVTHIQEKELAPWNKDIAIGAPVKLQHFVIYLRQFATLIQAGVTIVESTRILAMQTDSKALRKALLKIEDELRDGKPLSSAAADHPRIFPPMFVHMISAGEASGNLDDTLNRLAVYFEKQNETKQKIVSALVYPIILAIVAVGVIIFLLTSVVPTFASMFDGMGAELPAITLFVLGASAFIQQFWWLLIIISVILVVSLVYFYRKKSSKYYLDYVILKMPIFGKILQKAALARMARTLSSLFSSSVPILQAIAMVEKVVLNEVMAEVLKNSRESLEKGQPLTEPMRKHWIFPPLVTQMISIGEQTGALDTMLSKVADFYETEVSNATDRLKSLIEPLMIVFLAAIVGVIVLAIIVPMFEMFNHIG
jgi:type IV pilus assembly protein PilC